MALIEALQDVSGLKQSDAAMLLRNRDYEEFIENYETRDHRYITGFKGYRRGMARLYCVKLLQSAEARQAPTLEKPERQ